MPGPTAPHVEPLLRALFDPSLSLLDIADHLGLSLLQFADLAESPEVQSALARLTALAEARAAAFAARSLPAAAKAMSLTLSAYADVEQTAPPDDPATLTQRRLWADTARKATNLLHRLAKSGITADARTSPAPDPGTSGVAPSECGGDGIPPAPLPSSPASCLDASRLDAFFSVNPAHPTSRPRPPTALLELAGTPLPRARIHTSAAAPGAT